MIYVDQAVWPWRGDLWAHLISDSDPEELHDFAETIGKRRAGFQGDHYDVSTHERERALGAGARPVEARELVRKLSRSGLRRRGGLPKWNALLEQTCEPDAIAKLLSENLTGSNRNCELAKKLSTASAHLLGSATALGADFIQDFIQEQSQELTVVLLQRSFEDPHAATELTTSGLAEADQAATGPAEANQTTTGPAEADQTATGPAEADQTATGPAEAALLLSRPASSEHDRERHKPLGRSASKLGLALGISEVRKLVTLPPGKPAILGLDILVLHDHA